MRCCSTGKAKGREMGEMFARRKFDELALSRAVQGAGAGGRSRKRDVGKCTWVNMTHSIVV